MRFEFSARARSFLFFSAIILTAAFIFGALRPFQWRPPRILENGADLSSDRTLRLPKPGFAYVPTRPQWVESAIKSNRLRIELTVRSFAADQSRTARILTLSRDVSARNFTVGQDGSDLVLRLRRGELYNGTPEFRLASVFQSDDWHEVEIAVTEDDVTIRVDDDQVLNQPLPERPLQSWNRRFRIALGNEFTGNRPWLGEISRAVVHVGDQRFDYLGREDLVLPSRYVDGFHRDLLYPISDSTHRRDAVSDISLNILVFIPIGFLFAASIRRHPLRSTIVICAIVSLAAEIGQLCLESRLTSAIDLVDNTVGSAIGACLALKVCRIGGQNESGRL